MVSPRKTSSETRRPSGRGVVFRFPQLFTPSNLSNRGSPYTLRRSVGLFVPASKQRDALGFCRFDFTRHDGVGRRHCARVASH